MIDSSRHLDNGPDAADVWGFLLFSHGWTWTFWGVAVAMRWEAFAFPGVVFVVLGGVGPLLGGVAMTGVVDGREGLRELGRRIVDPRRIPGRWWLVTLMFIPAVTTLAAVLAVALGWTHQPFDLAEARSLLRRPLSLVGYAAFVLLLGPLPEEIGWRGYLLDRLQVRWRAAVSSLLVGLAWFTWHLPLFAMVGYYAAAGGPPDPVNFATGIVVASVFYTWLHNNTGRSVLAAILFHFTQNFTGQFLDLADATRTMQAALFVVLAVVVVAWWGPEHLRREGARPTP